MDKSAPLRNFFLEQFFRDRELDNDQEKNRETRREMEEEPASDFADLAWERERLVTMCGRYQHEMYGITLNQRKQQICKNSFYGFFELLMVSLSGFIIINFASPSVNYIKAEDF